VYYFLHVHIVQRLVSVAAIFNFWSNSRILYVIVIFHVLESGPGVFGVFGE